jgi:hypothetical protein
MQSVIVFFQSEMGRRVLAWLLVCLSGAAKGGLLPLDYAIPLIGLTTGQLLLMLGVGVATTAGSASRQ